jgi:predicted dithiol-disulfide oxidoreductase (DUF899 family)
LKRTALEPLEAFAMTENKTGRPEVVSADEWQRSLSDLTTKEKAHMRQGDTLSAERRRLPMVRVERDYTFQGEQGEVSLLELFDGRPQLIVYHFMFGPELDEGCPGCSWVVDGMTHPAHLHARDVSIVLISRARLDTLMRYRKRMDWSLPWYSSFDSAFNVDMGATIDGEENHGLSVFMRDGDDIYRTYYTGNRGIEHLGSHWTYLDLTPFGRQENWEDSPEGWPQTEPYSWTLRHDSY